MPKSDPDQDLLNKLDRQESLSSILRALPTAGIALALGFCVFLFLKFYVSWTLEMAGDAGMLAFILVGVSLLLGCSRVMDP